MRFANERGQKMNAAFKTSERLFCRRAAKSMQGFTNTSIRTLIALAAPRSRESQTIFFLSHPLSSENASRRIELGQ
jgi:hypothetical protein